MTTGETGRGRRYGRGAFILLVAGGVSALAWGEPASRFVGELVRRPLGSGGVLRSRGWRIYTINDTMPVFDPTRWTLVVDGLVARPLRLDYRDLVALPRAEQTSDFHCVTGWSVRDVRWAGVRFRDLLDAARPLPRARALHFVSSERPYVDGLTLDQALLDDVMLAYEMDGAPLPRPHGAPARVVMPGMYGYKNVKWVERITVSDREVNGYWEQRGYDRNAWVDRSNGYGA